MSGWTDTDEAEFRTMVDQQTARFLDAHFEVDATVSVLSNRALLAERPEVEDILNRVRRLGTEQGLDDETVEMAAGVVLEAAVEGT